VPSAEFWVPCHKKKNRKPLTEVTSSKKRNRRKEHLEKKKRKEKEKLLGNCPN